jgi:hypothetical protein
MPPPASTRAHIARAHAHVVFKRGQFPSAKNAYRAGCGREKPKREQQLETHGVARDGRWLCAYAMPPLPAILVGPLAASVALASATPIFPVDGADADALGFPPPVAACAAPGDWSLLYLAEPVPLADFDPLADPRTVRYWRGPVARRAAPQAALAAAVLLAWVTYIVGQLCRACCCRRTKPRLRGRRGSRARAVFAALAAALALAGAAACLYGLARGEPYLGRAVAGVFDATADVATAAASASAALASALVRASTSLAAAALDPPPGDDLTGAAADASSAAAAAAGAADAAARVVDAIESVRSRALPIIRPVNTAGWWESMRSSASLSSPASAWRPAPRSAGAASWASRSAPRSRSWRQMPCPRQGCT